MKETNEEMIKRLKEEELKDLKLRKEYLNKVNEVKKNSGLNKAMSELENMLEKDDTDDWVNKLNEKSAIADAKTEMLLENQQEELSLEEKAKKLLQQVKGVDENKVQKSNSLTLGDLEVNEEEKTDTENKSQNTDNNNSKTLL